MKILSSSIVLSVVLTCESMGFSSGTKKIRDVTAVVITSSSRASGRA